MRPDPDRLEAVEEAVAAVLRTKSGMERLRLAHEAWELARDRLTAFLASRNPHLPPGDVARLVAERLGIEPGCPEGERR